MDFCLFNLMKHTLNIFARHFCFLNLAYSGSGELQLPKFSTNAIILHIPKPGNRSSGHVKVY